MLQDLTVLNHLNILSIGESCINHVYVITFVLSTHVQRGLLCSVTLRTVTVWSQQNLCMLYSTVVARTLLLNLLLLLLLSEFILSVYTDFYLQD
jgi:hypothetical protein